MSDNLIETDIFERRRLQGIYTRLLGLNDARIEAIEKNPWPALQAANNEIFRLRKVIEDAYAAVTPQVKFVQDGDPIWQPSLCEEAMSRLSETAKILQKGLEIKEK